MSPVEKLLTHLKGVRRVGDGRWIARCPAHDDRAPSLSVREMADERVLIHCHAQCDPASIVGAVDMTLADLFPPRPIASDFAPRERRPWRASDVVRALEHELLVAIVFLGDVARGRPMTPADRDRAVEARQRMLCFLEELRNAT